MLRKAGSVPVMGTPSTPTQTAQAVIANRCDHRTDLGLGCARTLRHEGAHWLTSSPEAARADLVRIGFFQKP